MFRGLFRLRRSEMIIAIDLIPGTESIDKDRFTYPTFEPTPVFLCVLAPLREPRFARPCPPLRLCSLNRCLCSSSKTIFSRNIPVFLNRSWWTFLLLPHCNRA
jgi:hypothetical protein